MRLAVLSDIHNRYHIFEKVLSLISNKVSPDIWIYPGDIGDSINVFCRLVQKCKGTHVLIYGNHDPKAIKYINRRPKIWLLKFGERVKIKHLWFLGLPGNLGNGSRWYHWKAYELRDVIKKYRKKKIDIVVSHECPLGVADIKNEKHLGKEILRQLIVDLSPRIFICGHIHAGVQVGYINKTIVINAGAISYLDLSPPDYVIINLNDNIEVRGYSMHDAYGDNKNEL